MADLRALALIYDIRGFTAASKRLKTADLGAFATAAHRVILDLFAGHPPTFVKNLGDGHLLLWECAEGLDPVLVADVVEASQKARTAFAAFASAQRSAGQDLPGRVGIGVAFGEVSRSDDYYGRTLNLAGRLQGVARPEGLALDPGVFEAIAAKNEALRAVFKKARVRLKGLGSTLVWVDRPFSWARALAPVAKVAALLLLPLAYVLLSDAGLGLPGGEAVRTWLDAHEVTWFRPVAPTADVRQEADRLRRRLAAALLANRASGGWLRPSFKAGDDVDERKPDMWSFAQGTCALLRAPHLTREEFRSVLASFRGVLFDPSSYVEVDGRPLGWLPAPRPEVTPGKPRPVAYTEAEPTLWTVAALALALQRPEHLEPAERDALRAELQRAQAAAASFRPTDSGGWNIFPEQEHPKRHSPYSTTLAFLALLETHAAGEPWEGSVETRDRLLAQTAAFLLSRYQASESPAGWRRTGSSSDKISPGLTTQIFSELLRFESVGGTALPPAMVAAIPDHLVERAALRFSDDYDMGEFKVTFASHEVHRDGSPIALSMTEGINFLVHPWALDCAQRWLDRAAKKGADPADVVRVRRALGHMIVDEGEHAVGKALEGFIFVASETLYGLSAIPPPDPR